MSTLVIKGTCDDCRVEGYDFECDACIERLRMAGPCVCTCNEMLFEVAPVLQDEEECSCTTGLTEPGSYIISAWFGFQDSMSAVMADMRKVAALLYPSDPRLKFRMYGSGTGSGIPSLTCISSTDDWTPIAIDGAGGFVLYDPPGGSIEFDVSGQPIGGAFNISAADLGIEIEPVPGGTGVDCAQSGGHDAFLMQITTVDDQPLALCPFNGLVGAPACDRQPCCFWQYINDTPLVTSCSGGEEGTALITLDLELTGDCVCAVAATITINDGVSLPTVYILSTSPRHIEHEISPCSPDQQVSITLTQTYADCLDPTCIDSGFLQVVTL